MTPTPLTTELVAELRRLMDRVDCRNVLRPTQDEWNEFALACRLALPSLLDAAEREAKMRKALERLANAWDYAPYGTAHHITTCNQAAAAARAALAEGGAQ
jgi:hypothetical protein